MTNKAKKLLKVVSIRDCGGVSEEPTPLQRLDATIKFKPISNRPLQTNLTLV